MNNPLVSIIICCHNRAHFLPMTMESVFAQEYLPVEIIVCDDGSTDNTTELMAGYGDRIRYYRHENQGIAVTRTKASQLARGEFIAFQDDDDLMPPDRITRLYAALCQYPGAVFSMGDWACIDSEGNFTGRKTDFKSRLGINCDENFLIEDGYKAVMWSLVSPVPHTTLFRKTDGSRVGWFDDYFFHACEDTDFFAKLSQLGPIAYVPHIVSHYRTGHNQLFGDNFISLYSHFMLYSKHLKSLSSAQSELKKRFQVIILGLLEKMFYLKKTGDSVPDFIPEDYPQRGLSLLDAKKRLAYMGYKYIKYPIRRLIADINQTGGIR